MRPTMTSAMNSSIKKTARTPLKELVFPFFFSATQSVTIANLQKQYSCSMTHNTRQAVKPSPAAHSYYSSVFCWWLGLFFMAQAATEGVALLTSHEFSERLSLLETRHFLVMPSRTLYFLLCAIAGFIIWLVCSHYSKIVHHSQPRLFSNTLLCSMTIFILGLCAASIVFHTAALSIAALWMHAPIIVS